MGRNGVYRGELAVHETPQPLTAARVSKLAERLGLDLSDTLTGNSKLLTHFFKGVIRFLPNTESHSQDLLFPRRQGRQDLLGLLLQV